MILLIPLLLSFGFLLSLPSLLLFSLDTLRFPFLLLIRFTLGAEVGIFLYLRFVEAVDNGILAHGHMDLAHGAMRVEGYLACGHGGVFAEVGPWCVDYGDY